MEEIRAIIFLAMFAVLGWLDFRTRSIDDRLFLAFGGAGAALYALDWQGTDPYAVLLILCSASAAVMVWRMGIMGTADMFAMIAGAVIYPVYGGFVPTALVVFVGAIALSVAFTVGGNVLLNSSDALRGGVFRDVSDGRARKCAAFFLVHRQRGFERHVFLAENMVAGKRRLKMGRKPADHEFAELSTRRYVEYAAPFVTLAAASAFFAVGVEHAYQW